MEIRDLVWVDYRLAVIFTVVIPLWILFWSFRSRIESIQILLGIYWKVASLLMITVYLLIPSWSIGFITGTLARLLIPLSLWFWVDLNEEIRDLPDRLIKWVLIAWRWAVTVYCLAGVAFSFPYLSCAFTAGKIKTEYCTVWLEAPWQYRALLHGNSTPAFLGFLGIVGLCFYGLYFFSFVFFKLGRQGRIAIED